MLTIPVGMLLAGIYHLLIAITISKRKRIRGVISDFWKWEILRPFLKAFQHSNNWRLSEACRSNMLLATQTRMETHFCVADFFQNHKAISFYWLICQTKIARFLEVSCIILHFSWRKLQESCKNGKKCDVKRFLTRDFWLVNFSCKKTSIEQIKISLRDFFRKFSRFFCTCKITPS